MKTLVVIGALAIGLLLSCSTGNNDESFQTPEHSAISIATIPLFADSSYLANGKPFKFLKAGEVVYTTGDTITTPYWKITRVVWGDSSAYVPVRWLMPQGKEAVMVADKGILNFYADADLITNRLWTQENMRLVVAGASQGNITPILYKFGEDPDFAYVSTSQLYFDSLSLAFYHEYLKNPDLRNESKYANLAVFAAVFPNIDERGDSETGENP
ncbi:MAG: hypothetical protein WDO14_15035 [Bacteroidota bacterium]